MKKIYHLMLAIVITVASTAQSHVERVLILNEGYFDYFSNEIVIPVSLGAYQPETGVYTEVHTIDGVRFASDLLIYENNYYIAADNYLLVYDLYTDTLVMQKEIQGIRKIAVNANRIVVTRGEYLTAFDTYVEVLDKNTLDLIFSIPDAELPYTTEGVVIRDGKAYVAVNNGFVFGGEVGYLAIIDLELQQLEAMIDLGADGINPDNLMSDGETLFTLNNKDYTGSSVSSYKITSGDVSTTNLLNVTSGCGTSSYFNGEIYYQDFLSTSISRFNPVAETITGEMELGNSFYGLAFDPLSNIMYASVTDYFSYGKVNVYDLDGSLLNTFDVGVSPGNIAFDVRTA
ncbi:MAG: YncE family protein, partial [Chitinophagales bacterium]